MTDPTTDWIRPISLEVITGSVRVGRFGPVVADWFARTVAGRDDLRGSFG